MAGKEDFDDETEIEDEDPEVIEPESEGDGEEPEDSEASSEGDGARQTRDARGREPGEQARTQDRERSPVSRSDRRIQRLANEAREAREAANRTAAQLAETQNHLLRLQAGQGRPDPREEAERLAQMDPETRQAYLLDQSERRHQTDMARLQFNMNDNLDRSKFEARATSDARVARYKDDVEAALQQARQQGMNPARETIYFYLLGKKVAENAGKKPQAAAAGRRVAANTGKPANTSGDVGAGRRGAKSLEQKLDGVII
jgi:hypothetical protein